MQTIIKIDGKIFAFETIKQATTVLEALSAATCVKEVSSYTYASNNPYKDLYKEDRSPEVVLQIQDIELCDKATAEKAKEWDKAYRESN